MKKIIAVLLICAAVFCIASCKKEDNTRVEMKSAEEVAAKIGADFVLPKSIKYPAFYVVEDVIGEAEFAFNGFVFTFRASKLKAGDSLYKKDDSVVGTSSFDIDTRATVTINSYSDGSRLATWHYKGTNHVLYTEKSANDDVFTELCDLLVR